MMQKNIIISAHGNTIRALGKKIFNISDKNINSLEDLKNLSPSKLKSLLKRFVKSENYETAAIIRDEILKRELK